MRIVRGSSVFFLAGMLAAVSYASPVPQQAGPSSEQTLANQSSLANAALKAREAKKHEPKTDVKVWDNDNLPAEGDVSVVGSGTEASTTTTDKPTGDNSKSATPAASEADNSKTGDSGASSSDSAKSDKGTSALKEQLAQAREHLADLEQDYDLAQRQLDLDEKQISQEPTYLDDRSAQDKIKSESDDVKAKQQDVDEARKAVQDMEAQLKSDN